MIFSTSNSRQFPTGSGYIIVNGVKDEYMGAFQLKIMKGTAFFSKGPSYSVKQLAYDSATGADDFSKSKHIDDITQLLPEASQNCTPDGNIVIYAEGFLSDFRGNDMIRHSCTTCNSTVQDGEKTCNKGHPTENAKTTWLIKVSLVTPI